MKTRLFSILFLALAVGCSSSSSKKTTQDATEVAADTCEDVAADTTADVGDAGQEIRDVSPGDTTSPEVSDLIAKGKEALHNAEPVMAADFFRQALAKAPKNNQALFGAALARTIAAVEMLGMMATLESQYKGYGAGSGTRATENDYMASTLSGLLDSLRKELVDANNLLKQVDPNGFKWTCDSIPVYFGSGPIMVYGKTFDSSDLPLIAAIHDFSIWMLDLLTAQDLSSDLVTGYRLAKSIQDMPTGGLVLKIVAYLAAYNEGFLKLDKERGLKQFQDGKERMIAVGEDLLLAYQRLQAETPDKDQVSVWNEDENAVEVHDYAAVTDGVLDPQPFLFHGGKGFIDATTNLLDALKQDSKVVPIGDSLYLQLSTILVAATQVHILDTFGVSLPIDISNFDAMQLKEALGVLAKSDIGLNWAAFHKNPIGLRVILPAIKPGYDKPFDAQLYIEWECPEELAENGGFPKGSGGLFCSKDAKLTDSAHFVGTPYEIPKDGIPSGGPYIAWKDPTMGGLVYIDKGKMDGGESKFVPADNYTLNIAVQQLLKLLLKK